MAYFQPPSEDALPPPAEYGTFQKIPEVNWNKIKIGFIYDMIEKTLRTGERQFDFSDRCPNIMVYTEEYFVAEILYNLPRFEIIPFVDILPDAPFQPIVERYGVNFLGTLTDLEEIGKEGILSACTQIDLSQKELSNKKREEWKKKNLAKRQKESAQNTQLAAQVTVQTVSQYMRQCDHLKRQQQLALHQQRAQQQRAQKQQQQQNPQQPK